MKHLENYGVEELSSSEINQIEGGGWIADFVNAIKCTFDPANYTPRPGQIYYY